MGNAVCDCNQHRICYKYGNFQRADIAAYCGSYHGDCSKKIYADYTDRGMFGAEPVFWYVVFVLEIISGKMSGDRENNE